MPMRQPPQTFTSSTRVQNTKGKYLFRTSVLPEKISGMTPDEIELQCAKEVLLSARFRARYHCQPGDLEAVTAAILVLALELATPQLSDRNRAAIFWSED